MQQRRTKKTAAGRIRAAQTANEREVLKLIRHGMKSGDLWNPWSSRTALYNALMRLEAKRAVRWRRRFARNGLSECGWVVVSRGATR